VRVELVLFTGIGPLFAWRRVSLGAARRLLAWPALAAVVVTGLLILLTDADSHPFALVMFALVKPMRRLMGESGAPATELRTRTGT